MHTKEGVCFYARQGWAGGGGVWEWDINELKQPVADVGKGS